MSVVIHNGVLEERRTYPVSWGYVACEGGSRAMTRAELAELSTRITPELVKSLGYPQPAGEIRLGTALPPVSGPQAVDNP